jgi:hypothetical protein
MATQYTAGLLPGQVLTAGIMNQIGAEWVDFTPTLTQGGNVTKTVVQARYCQIQKTVIGQLVMNVTGAGTGATAVAIGLPIAARATNAIVSYGYLYDANTNTIYNVTGFTASTTTMQFFYQTGNTFGVSPNVALANTDQLAIQFSYEV